MSKRILIVEDDRNTRRALVAVFTRLGMVSTEAESVKQALERLNRNTDVICLDLTLPDGSGADVLKYVRQTEMAAKVAVISAADEPFMLAAVTALKPDAIFGKPLDLPDFLDWLKSIGIETSVKHRLLPLRTAV